MEIKRTFDILDHLLENFQKSDNLAVKRNGQWEKFSAQEIKQNVDWFSYGLLAMGFEKGQMIATVSNNRPEWNFVDFGMSQIGVVHVPVYPTISEAEYEHVLSHSEARILIVNSEIRYNIVGSVAKKIKNIEQIYTFDKVKGVENYETIIELGKKNQSKFEKRLSEIKNEINENDLCSIVYTSGTTGLSKGVMLSHKNFVSNVLASQNVLVKDAKCALSFLPLCHVFERMINYLYLTCGVSIYYAESIDTIGENLKEITPDVFVTVPRVLERLYDKIYGKGKDLTGVKKAAFFAAIDLGLKYNPEKEYGFLFKQRLALYNKLVFSKWREALGGNIKQIVSGGAALQPRLANIFWAAGIPIIEGYGLTETSPVIAVNKVDPKNYKTGTVGRLISTSQVKIDEDGEILFKGPNLMLGYFKDPEKTAEVIDSEGWFHTGDIGILDDGFLKITDRKKEMFKLSTGKYVAPQMIENRFKESPFIEQLMVVGDNEKFCAAIICPCFEYLHDWASLHQVHYRDNLDLIKNQKVLTRYIEELEKFNKTLDHAMTVKKFALTCQNWTTDTGELSPTLKLKRKFIKEKYRIKLDHLYGYSPDEGNVGNPKID
jgi:long-chain acyl-CoA synthetase